MADFEDALTPTWDNVVAGQLNLREAVAGTLADGDLRLAEQTAVLHVRPRGWHLDERHVKVDDTPVTAALFDVAVYAFHNAAALISAGRGPYLYLPKLESHREARLWADVLAHIEDRLGLARGSFRVTVLIETVPAAFEMEEILWELREHVAALNAGRWDYIFSNDQVPHRTRGLPVARSRPDHDDRPLHARVYRAPREDLPPPRRDGDRRHGRADPQPARPGGE